jgi:hypothetical protein
LICTNCRVENKGKASGKTAFRKVGKRQASAAGTEWILCLDRIGRGGGKRNSARRPLPSPGLPSLSRLLVESSGGGGSIITGAPNPEFQTRHAHTSN